MPVPPDQHPRKVRCRKCGAFPGWLCSTRDARRQLVRLKHYHPERWADAKQEAREAS